MILLYQIGDTQHTEKSHIYGILKIDPINNRVFPQVKPICKKSSFCFLECMSLLKECDFLPTLIFYSSIPGSMSHIDRSIFMCKYFRLSSKEKLHTDIWMQFPFTAKKA